MAVNYHGKKFYGIDPIDSDLDGSLIVYANNKTLLFER
jgi:hypothetical protein